MQLTTTRKAALALTLVAALGLSACGKDDNSASASGTAVATTTAGGASTTAAGAASMTPFGSGCSAVPTSGAGSFDGMAQAPAATAASNNPALSTLVSAVQAAGLVDTLNGPGPFTIFAPANDAFTKIPAATLSQLLADPKGDLTKILTYHVVAGEKLSPEQLVETPLTTVNGATLQVTKSGDDYMVNGTSNVICGNVQTANATVYIIDSVLMPPAAGAMASGATSTTMAGNTMASGKTFGSACSSVPATGAGSFAGMAQAPAATAASNNPVLSTLVSAVQAAGLVDTLNGPGPFTIFAPANDAFTKIPAATLSGVMGDPSGALTKILTYHVVAGQKMDAAMLAQAGTVTTVEGGTLTIAKSGDTLTVNGSANVICGNVQTANATVFIIDSVLMPS
jgi:uncharacterized surface protein with fasciclin (FAS1) repeats